MFSSRSSNGIRAGKREFNELRELKVTYDIYAYTQGSVLFEIGNTKILCSVTLQNSVPHFLKGKRKGWLTAEYALLPAATPIRTVREISANKRNGRTIEISRLIGRILRSIADLSVLGESTIFIDCDVLQADGGTRTACITAAYLALKCAQQRLINDGTINDVILNDEIASVSVGIGPNGILMDMDFNEDSALYADYNFILTRASNKIVEIQGSTECNPICWSEFENLKELALKGAQDIFGFYDKNCYILSPNEKKIMRHHLYTSCYKDSLDFI
jgi:ribonuclease PH